MSNWSWNQFDGELTVDDGNGKQLILLIPSHERIAKLEKKVFGEVYGNQTKTYSQWNPGKYDATTDPKKLKSRIANFKLEDER